MPRESSSRILSTKRVKALTNSSEWTFDPELTARIPDHLYTSAIYRHLSGEILAVLNDGKGWVYESRDAWLSHIELIEKHRNEEPAHILDGRLPQGQNFVNEVSELINQLAVKLHIPREELDYSQSSLKKVEKAVRRQGPEKCLEADIFAPLVAYVGEAIKQRTGGRWELSLVPDETEIWEPMIVDASGRSIDFASLLYDELAEEPQCSISSVVNMWCA